MLCGMRFVPPLVLHGAHRVDDDELRAHVALVTDRLLATPTGLSSTISRRRANARCPEARPAPPPADDMDHLLALGSA